MILKKLNKYLKVVSIDVLIYKMTIDDLIPFPKIDYEIQSELAAGKKIKYFINHNGRTIHKSFLFNSLHILKLIGKKGPAIGDCATINEFKGKSIYPFMINYIACEILHKGLVPEIFIIVNPTNSSSIRGIEKAGFKMHSKIYAKRLLLLFYNVKISNP